MNERRVRREIEHGASTIEEVALACKAGSCCYGCHPVIEELLAESVTTVRVAGRRGRLSIA